MSEKKPAELEKCKRCGLPKTARVTDMLDAPDKCCAAGTYDSVAGRVCDGNTMLRLSKLASEGINAGLLFSVQYNGKATERAMRKAQAELDEIVERMKDRLQ